MGFGIVSDEEFEKELSRAIQNYEIKQIERGRKPGSREVPDTLRKIIGEEAAINGRQSGLQIAQQFGISESSVDAYKVGARSEATYNDRPASEYINQAKARVAKRARNKLIQAIHHITEDKLAEAKAKDLAGVAKDMSAVIRNMEPEMKREDGQKGPTFIFYCPQTRSEDTFDAVFVGE